MHDVVVIGFGPSGLALAVALEEQGMLERALFLERKREFSWHDGMLLDDARLQVSCLKDLATLRDPRSRFTFLNYLKCAGRLDEFVNMGSLRPTRVEFNDYLRWAAEQVRSSVVYGTQALAVEPVFERRDRVVALRVTARGPAEGDVREHLARNLVLAAGAEPRVPDGIDPAGERIFHSEEFLHRIARRFPDRERAHRFVVVGDGQSGAEVFDQLAARYPHARVTAAVRGIGYRPIDETPFANEAFFPRSVDFFHGLSEQKRQAMLAGWRSLNYGVVERELIERIYRRVYDARVLGRRVLEIRPFLELTAAVEDGDGVGIELADRLHDRTVRIEADALVLATGYTAANPHPLLDALSPYLETDVGSRYRVDRDYRVRSGSGFEAGVFLQGYAEGSHGIGDTLLSVSSIRAWEIGRSIEQRRNGQETHPMHVSKFDAALLEREYGESTLRVVAPDGLPQLPFGAMWIALDPGQSSAPDTHHEAEAFFIFEGEGRVAVNGERSAVARGDVVHLTPFDEHTIHNDSPDAELRLLTVWWEDPELLRSAERRWDDEAGAETAGRVLITATPPTVNGELHLGHISGPYLAADILRRYLELCGREVYSITGSDENQSYVVTKAAQKGWTAGETAARFGDGVEGALAALGIETDVYARPSTSPHHARMCQEFFSRLHDAGALELRTAPSLFCDACDRYLFEAHVSGLCPHCGHGSDGCACEDCARPNDCVDLVEPRCNGCGAVPAVRDVARFYFPLSRYEEQLREYVRSVRMTPHMLSLCEQMIADGLPDIAASHVADWGIPVPVEGFEDQVIYVWLEMCPGYLAATQQLADASESLSGWEDLWKDEDAEIVQFFGFDNGYFHALLFPALLMAFDPAVRLPSGFVTNEFYLLDGEKFSSSREHAIWAREFAEHEPADAIRFFLSLDRPEHKRTSFTLGEYETRVQAELLDGWLPWLSGLGRRVVDEFGGLAPGTSSYTTAHEVFFRSLTRRIRQLEDALGPAGFSPAQAARALCELAGDAERLGAAEQHAAGAAGLTAERRTAVALELAAARCLATMAYPLVPDLSARLWAALGFEDERPRRWDPTVAFVPAGQDVSGLRELTVA